MRLCNKCGVERPLERFREYTTTAGNTLRRWTCLDCALVRKRTPEYREGQRNRMHAGRGRRSNLKRHSLTEAQFEDLYLFQGGVCATCYKPCKTGSELSIDHDHSCCPGNTSCGRCIRGLLCRSCNSALGYAKDSPELLQNMTRYLIEGRL